MGSTDTSPARRTITRHDLIGLGRAGRPREFIPVACEVLERVGEDPGLRFLLGANIAQLGLRTLARETLAGLPGAALDDPDVRGLLRAIEALPDDRVGARERRETARGNLRALRVRGVRLGEAFAEWSSGLDENECFRCADGNIVRRLRGRGGAGWTHFLSDQRGAAERFTREKLATADLFPRPLTIEGLDPPWLFDLAWRALPRNRVGFAAPISIVQTDPLEFLDGLSACDLREALVDPRVRAFVGADAAQRWLNDALDRLDEVVLGAVVPLRVTRTRAEPSLEALMGRASAAQAEEFRRVQARVEERYRGRDARWWAARYAEALGGGGRPLRVLVPTSRYSTYIRHAAEDLAAAFRSLGCEAEVAMEARPDSRPSTVGHVRTVDRFEPDLIALINFFRGDAGLPFPDNVPWLCWVQDALPHQFKDREWGELDFVAGHVHKELLAQGGFPRERTRQFPVVASAAKFHSGAVDAGMRARFACEVAYVSHQSETPRVFHERCKAEAADARCSAMLEALRPVVEAEALDPMSSSLTHRLEMATRRVFDRPDAGLGVTYVFRHYALPLADRVLRHQMLGWAAGMCRRRGWRLRIYGRGWGDHPEFAPFARGDVAHGEELRACYKSSLVHLHASVSALVHQRVMECALSGGLPLARLTYDALSESEGWARREAILHCRPIGHNEGKTGYATGDSPALREMAEQRRRLGLEFPEIVWLSARKIEAMQRPDHPAATGLHPAWLLGDLREGTFRSEEELEQAVGQLLEDPARRRARSEAMAARVRERCTTEVFAREMLGLIRGSLGAAGAERSRAA